MRLAAAFLLALSATAAEQTLNQKAVEYLESASLMIGGTPPEFQPGALLQLAIVQAHVNKAKSVELFEQAISACASLPVKDNLRERYLSIAIEELARVDVELAVEKLSAAEKPPLNGVLARLLEQQKLDRAIEVLDRYAFSTTYPYNGVGSVIKALPADDSRRVLLFSQSVAAFQQRPSINEFEAFVREFRPGKKNAMPAGIFDSSVRALIGAALDNKGVEQRTQSITTGAGTVSINDPQDVALFNLADLAQAIEPALVEKMKADRPAVQMALERFPQGKQSLNKGDGVTASSPAGVSAQHVQRVALETMRFQEVMVWHQKDPYKALEASRAIPTPILRQRAIVTIAMAQPADKPESAKPVLARCVDALAEVDDAGARAAAWAGLASVAQRLNDRDLALKLLERGISDARVLYKSDANPDNPNLAPRTAWPSSAAYRAIFYQAAKLLGADADTLVEKIPDAEIQALARIEMAAAWLGVRSTPGVTLVSRAKTT
jgi:hypothetical protein